MLDEKSLEILQILQDKARIPNTEVSRKVGLAPSAVLERIRKMESQGTIDGYEVRLNPERFSRNQIAFITVCCESNNNQDDSLAKALAGIEDVQEVHYLAGQDCFLVKVRVADVAELNALLKNQIHTLPGIFSTKTFPVLETYKETAKIRIV